MAQDSSEQMQNGDQAATNGVSPAAEKQEQDNQRPQSKQSDGPEGGFDDTPIPPAPPGVVGYTLKFTMLQATDLAMGDAHAFSSDPYVLAQLNTNLSFRHKEDPRLRFRTPTVRKNTNPVWNEEWIVANVPSSGFKLKLRIYDEDPADHDDILGKVHVTVPFVDDEWKGIKNQAYRIVLRDSSKRALMVRAVANCFRKVHHLRGELFLSIENLGRTGQDGQNFRPYTVGVCRWIRHQSPLLGRLANVKDTNEKDHTDYANMEVEAHNHSNNNNHKPENDKNNQKAERYNFQANQFQFPGPIPAELYHRFVEFKPWVRRMFNTSGFSGVLLGKALHHQHARVYNFDRTTVWGHFPQGPCEEMTQQFLDLVHYDKGGRIFTYILTLDALFRFTETGKEFGVDMLSKHTMHSDVSIYIAFSGEFFIRRLKHRRSPNHSRSKSNQSQQSQEPGDPVSNENLLAPAPTEDEAPTDPSHYELVIDNDSGTYRPDAALLPVLAEYLAKVLPGLHVKTLDCQADADEQQQLKTEQRERKQREGDHIVYTQASDSSSISSSDEEDLDEIQAAYQADGTPQQGGLRASRVDRDGSKKRRSENRETLQSVVKDAKMHQGAHMEKFGRTYLGRSREDVSAAGPA